VAAHDPGHGFPAVLEQLCGEGAHYEIGRPYPPINNSGFVSNYARAHRELPDGAMKCFTPDQVPVLTALAREFLVCDRWFCSMPGPTEPNRWFVHAATAGTLDESPTKEEYFESMANPWGGFEFERGTIYDLLRKADVKFRIYAGDEIPSVALLDGVSRTFDIDDFDDDFAEDVASPSYDAAYTFIEPSYDVFSDYKGGSSQHPLGSVVAGELLIKRTYEALRRSPIWESSLLVVLYDEHGGFYDHVAPPPARATGSKGRKFGFAFDQLGPRVPAIIVSPLIPRNQIDHRQYEHSSVISTLIDLFHLDPLTARSSASSGLKHLATLAAPRTDAPMTLPDPMRRTVARMVKIPFSDRVAEKPNAPLSDDPHGTLALAVRSGLAQHLEVTPPPEHEAIRARVKALRTRAEALQYLKNVAALVKHARAEAGVRRSATVRAQS
jgi:phospholipase C